MARLLLISSLPSGNDGEGTKRGGLSAANPPGDEKNRQRRSNGRVINMGGGKELAAIRAQIEDLLWPEDGEGRNPDELTVRCAGILYAGARKGIFLPEESVEYLQDSRERLDALLERMARMRKKANRIRKAIRKYLWEIQKGGSVEIQFSPEGAEELDPLAPNSPPKREPPGRRKGG